MRVVAFALLTTLCALPLSAQIFPTPGGQSPRIQTVAWMPGESIVLTAMPETTLTVMLQPGERITRAELGGSRAWNVGVSAQADSFQVTPQGGATPAELRVETTMRSYIFLLETGLGLQAAYLVQLDYGGAPLQSTPGDDTAIDNLVWSYRLRGDRSVRPASIRDNGDKTVIEYAQGQALPAVFAIGPTGDEEVVDGYMRDGRFVIDRVHRELIFRIDKAKATARRNDAQDGEG